MARRTRTKRDKGSNRKIANLLAAPKPEPTTNDILEASAKGDAIMSWFNSGDAYHLATSIVDR